MTKNHQAFFDQITKFVQKQNTTISLENLSGHNILFITDMINGFCKQGKLADVEINKIILPIQKLVTKAFSLNMKAIAFNDAHNSFSPEFESYAEHCIENSKEAKLVSELEFPEIKIINKNSTNGFFAFDFKPNLQWDNIIIVGCCTDICIKQLALSCKAWFNQHNKKVNIIVAKNLTATFNSHEHPSEIINNLSWYEMAKNGIKIVEDIQ